MEVLASYLSLSWVSSNFRVQCALAEQLSLHYSIQQSSIQKNPGAAGGAKIIFRIECDARPIASGTLKWMDATQ